jgi:hypothetical protein
VIPRQVSGPHWIRPEFDVVAREVPLRLEVVINDLLKNILFHVVITILRASDLAPRSASWLKARGGMGDGLRAGPSPVLM